MIYAAYAIIGFVTLATIVFVYFGVSILYTDYKRRFQHPGISLAELQKRLVQAKINLQSSIAEIHEVQQATATVSTASMISPIPETSQTQQVIGSTSGPQITSLNNSASSGQILPAQTGQMPSSDHPLL